MPDEAIDHPDHYGGADNPYEAIKVIEAWYAGFCVGNALKYISRAGKKGGESAQRDLGKALWYLRRAKEGGKALETRGYMRRLAVHRTYRVANVAVAWGVEGEMVDVLHYLHPHARECEAMDLAIGHLESYIEAKFA